MKLPFKDLAKGARFKYPDGNDTWVVLENYNSGLVAKWDGVHATWHQSLCCFVDDEWSLESEVEVVNDLDDLMGQIKDLQEKFDITTIAYDAVKVGYQTNEKQLNRVRTVIEDVIECTTDPLASSVLEKLLSELNQ